jgi:hypothetical protein
MTLDALRIIAISEACRVAWERTGTITLLDDHYMLAWSHLSLLYRRNDLGQLNPVQQKR